MSNFVFIACAAAFVATLVVCFSASPLFKREEVPLIKAGAQNSDNHIQHSSSNPSSSSSPPPNTNVLDPTPDDMVDKKLEASIKEFEDITSASPTSARKYLQKYKTLERAVDAFYNNQREFEEPISTDKIVALFNKYKDRDGDDITIDGTIAFCEALDVDPENVVLLAVAYELKSPRMGQWTKQGWVEGWKKLGCDSIPAMKAALDPLQTKLATDPVYFQKVYNYTFEFAKSEGQRSLALETAQAFWSLLLPHGLPGGALTRCNSEDTRPIGWKAEFTELWFMFLNKKGGKGVSKDTWAMFLEFVRAIDGKFSNYDYDSSWPSTIDDFVEFAKESGVP